MIHRLLTKLLGSGPASQKAEVPPPPMRVKEVQFAVAPSAEAVHSAVPIDPAKDPGLLIVDADAIVASQHDLVQMLRRHASLPDADFERMYLGPIRRLADYIGLLPASSGGNHNGAGGLFRLGLEMGVHAARAADGVMFATTETIERKRASESAWRHATFLAAMCAELYRPLTELQVVAPSGSVWGPYIESLNTWGRRERTKIVYVRWLKRSGEPAGAKAASAWIFNTVTGNELLGSLHAVNPRIVETAAAAISGLINALDDHPMMRVITGVRQRVIASDEALKPTLYGQLTQGTHIEPVLLDAIRKLITGGDWQINDRRGRLHFAKDGLFLTWPVGGADLLKSLAKAKTEGVPSQEGTVAEILLSSGVLSPGQNSLPWHTIFPVYGPEESGPQQIMAVRFARPASILPDSMLEQAVKWAASSGAKAEQPVVTPTPKKAAERATPKAATVTLVAEEAKSAEPAHVDLVAATPPPAPSPNPNTEEASRATEAAVATPDVQKAPSAPQPEASSGELTAPDLGTADEQAIAPPTSAPPAPAPRSPRGSKGKGGAIAEAAEVSSDVSGIAPDILAALGMPVAREVARWRDLWNAGKSEKRFLLLETGLAVHTGVVHEGLLDFSRIIEPIKENGWMELKETGNRLIPVHKVEFPGGTGLGYIIKKSFAKRCGFQIP